MNTAPRLRWDGMDRRLTNYGCGLLGLENDRRAFWQSLATVAGRRAELPDLMSDDDLADISRLTRGWYRVQTRHADNGPYQSIAWPADYLSIGPTDEIEEFDLYGRRRNVWGTYGP